MQLVILYGVSNPYFNKLVFRLDHKNVDHIDKAGR